MKKVFEYINKNYREKKFYMRLVVFSLLISIVPIFVTSIITYANANNLFREDAASKNMVLTEQVKQTLEVLIYQLEENGKQMLSDSSFLNFHRFNDGEYYENLHGAIPEEELYPNYMYIMYKHEVLDLMRQFRVTNPLIHTIHFYDKDKELILTFPENQYFRQYDMNTDAHQHFYETIVTIPELTYLIQHPDPFEAEETVDKLSLIIRSHADQFLVINLNESRLHQQLFSKLSEENNLLVVSDNEDVIYQSEAEQVPKEVKNSVQDIVNNSANEDTILKNGYLLTKNYSPTLQMSFISYESVSELNEALHQLQIQIILLLCTLIVAVLIVVFLYTKRLYSPVERVVHTIETYRDEKNTDTSDEFEFIHNYFKMTTKKKEQLINELKESLPHYKENFVRSLFKSGQWSLEDIQKKLDYLEVNLELGPILCAVLSIDQYDQILIEEDTKFVELYRMKVIHYMDTHDYQGENSLVVKVEDDKIAIVFNATDSDLPKLKAILETMPLDLHQKTGDYFTIGVSQLHENIKSLPNAFKEADKATELRIIQGRNKIIPYQELREVTPAVKDNMQEVINEYSSNLRLGYPEAAHRQLLEMMDKLSDNPIDTEETRLFLNRLLKGFEHEAIIQGKELNDILEFDPHDDLAEMKYKEEIISMFHYMANKFNLQEESDVEESPHIRKIMDIIDADLGQDLSLTAMAEKLELNSSYISRIFKEYVGQNYVDFITNRRIEKGKELLKTTKQKVGDIALHVGYQNSYYFIKLFKKAEGMTPGEYRKKHRQAKES